MAFIYTNPYIIKEIKNLVTEGRADSMKEAINIMIDEQHNKKMLLNQAEQLAATKDAASAARTAAIFSFGTYTNTYK
ncbi:MAG: hypothetical protein WCG21_01690 [Eubacteriales bacterium]